MSLRARVITLVAVVLIAVGGTVGYIVHSRQGRAAAVANAVPVPTTQDVPLLSAGPRIVFRNTAVGKSYGRVAMVPLTDPAGPRGITPATCDRVYAVATGAVCLYAKPAMVTTYQAQMLDADWRVVRDLPLSGVPSRTRLSKDGTVVATTTFVSGHDYATAGSFATATLVTRLASDETVNIETFDVMVDGKKITAADLNLWGVTFVDDDAFYATAASGGKTWLVHGSLSSKRLTAVLQDAECPSLSPDGTRVAFKHRGGQAAGNWHIAVYDLAAGTTTVLSEKRSVDDQIEWLDYQHVIYGLPRAGTGPTASDVWTVSADGNGTPSLFIPDAWSPAVIR